MVRGIRDSRRKIGKRFQNAQGLWATLVKDVDYKQVEIIFDSGVVRVVQYTHLRTGVFVDFTQPHILGIGYTGEKISNSDKMLYHRWYAMLDRCYSGKNKLYSKVSVSKEWQDFRNYRNWIIDAGYNQHKDWHVDKDVLGDGLLYSPTTCLFLPVSLNVTVQRNKQEDTSCKTMGVSLINGMYYAQISFGGSRSVLLGKFDKEFDAMMCYKIKKESHVKKEAEKWKGIISDQAYKALLNWELPC